MQLDRLYNYPELRVSVDTSNEEAQKVNAKLNTMSGKIAGLLSFVDSEILALSEETLNELQEKLIILTLLRDYMIESRINYQLK